MSLPLLKLSPDPLIDPGGIIGRPMLGSLPKVDLGLEEENTKLG